MGGDILLPVNSITVFQILYNIIFSLSLRLCASAFKKGLAA
jgi:hypothetical protein